MKTRGLWAMSGAFLSVAYVAVVGFLTLRMIGVRGGAVFGVDNQVVAVTTPRPGVLESLGMTVISCVVLVVLVFAARRRPVPDQLALRLSFATLTLLQIAVSAILQIETYSFVRGSDDEFILWWGGWFLKVGLNPAAHLTLAVSLFLVAMSVLALRPQRHTATAGPRSSGHAGSASSGA